MLNTVARGCQHQIGGGVCLCAFDAGVLGIGQAWFTRGRVEGVNRLTHKFRWHLLAACTGPCLQRPEMSDVQGDGGLLSVPPRKRVNP